MSSLTKKNILKYSVNVDSIKAVIESIDNHIEQSQLANRTCWLACFNPHSYYIACRQNEFAAALNDADWLIPDGSGVVIASKILRLNVHERVTESDIFWGLHHRLNQQEKYSVFFLGSTEENLKKMTAKMAQDYPNVRVAGTYSPPYKSGYNQDELDEMIGVINKSKADVLWVEMTAPKQEKWIQQNKDRLNVKFIAAVGAVFDFYTGEVRRSPVVFQKLGLEWLPRLVQQPRRLWRRMFISAPYFMWHVLLHKIKLR